jgi:DNA-binding response OmpR family regulator
MSERKGRLDKMVAGTGKAPIPVRSEPGPTPRKRALLFAPEPAPASAYVSLLEAEGFDVLVAQEADGAEALIRSAPPQFILAVTPTLGPKVLNAWQTLVPEAEVRQIPDLTSLLAERLVPQSKLLRFTLKSLSAAAEIASGEQGAPRGRTAQVLRLAEAGGQALGFIERDLVTTRLAVVLGDLLSALDNRGPEDGSSAADETAGDRRRALAEFSTAVECPFPVGSPLPQEPPSHRAATPDEVAEASLAFVILRERQDPDPPLALRRLAVEQEGERPTLHPAAVEAVLAAARREVEGSLADILLVDPDASSRGVLALRLSNEGYSVRTTGDGRSALEEVSRQRPALILSEAVLPGLDGYSLLDSLNREALGPIPFLYLSSRDDPLSINKGLLLGAADFLTKPVNFEILLTKMERALARQVDVQSVSARLSLSDVTQVTEGSGPLVDYADLEPGVVILGRFRVEASLGEGGMGKVFSAHDERLEESVVIKVMKPGLSEAILRRFKREIRLARKITHPSVVRIFDFWEAGALKFVTMELIEGNTLRQELDRRGAFPVPVTLRLGGEIFEALAAAHAVGVVHRDIKPDNVLLLPNGKIKVLDFGIAQGLEPEVSADVTVSPSIVGTPEYMSPEQLMGGQVDVGTDIYSTGLVLYEMLTAETPFQGPDRLAVAHQRISHDPQPPSRKNPQIPGAVDTFILRLLMRTPNTRYQSAEEAIAVISKLRGS